MPNCISLRFTCCIALCICQLSCRFRSKARCSHVCPCFRSTVEVCGSIRWYHLADVLQRGRQAVRIGLPLADLPAKSLHEQPDASNLRYAVFVVAAETITVAL